MRAALLAALLLVAVAPPLAGAQQNGGALVVTLNGVDIRTAARSPDALGLDTGAPALLNISITAPTDATWNVRVVRVTAVSGAVGDRNLGGFSRDVDIDSTIPPGQTLIVERFVDLSPMRVVGAGVFRMEARVLDDAGAELLAQQFFVRVSGNPLLTAAGALAAALTAVTGYGLWRLIRDLRELQAARERHRREEEAQRSKQEKHAVAARVGAAIGTGLDLTAGVEGVVGVLGGADKRSQKLARQAPVKWTLTGIGLGSVLVSWAQALGFVPFDVATLALAAAGVGSVLLVLGLVVAARARPTAERGPA